MKIAIVGGGISGLVAAHLLHARHEIEVFESEARVGGHTNTVDVDLAGRRHAIDTGFIVYNERTYPLFTRLLRQLAVETRPTEMSFGLHCERSGLEWASRGLRSLFAQPRNLLRPSFHRMLRDVLRFNREAPGLLLHGEEKTTLGDYLCGAGYSSEFVDHYVVPMGAAIWSAAPGDFLRMPATTFVRFFENHGLLSTRPSLPWRVVAGGSSRYVEALVAPFADRIRTGSAVRCVRRLQQGVEVTAAGVARRFDHVVLAVHPDQALRMLADPSPVESRVLAAIRTQRNEVVLHTDVSLMPERSRAWASWNYRIPAGERAPAIVTYDMNRLQGLASEPRFLVSLNATDRIDPRQILRRFVYHHPVFDAKAIEAQKWHAELSGTRNTHYCGAWWGHGFHEDGVRSAVEACRRFGGEI